MMASNILLVVSMLLLLLFSPLEIKDQHCHRGHVTTDCCIKLRNALDDAKWPYFILDLLQSCTHYFRIVSLANHILRVMNSYHRDGVNVSCAFFTIKQGFGGAQESKEKTKILSESCSIIFQQILDKWLYVVGSAPLKLGAEREISILEG